MNRRGFLKKSFLGLLHGTIGVSLIACEDSSPTFVEDSDNMTFASSTVASHSHTITLSRENIENPPQNGLSITTSSSSAHTHTISISLAQLVAIGGGQILQISDSLVNNHQHTYRLQRWF